MNIQTALLIDQLMRIGFTDCAKCEKCAAPLVVYPDGPWNYINGKWTHTCIISDKPVD